MSCVLPESVGEVEINKILPSFLPTTSLENAPTIWWCSHTSDYANTGILHILLMSNAHKQCKRNTRARAHTHTHWKTNWDTHCHILGGRVRDALRSLKDRWITQSVVCHHARSHQTTRTWHWLERFGLLCVDLNILSVKNVSAKGGIKWGRNDKKEILDDPKRRKDCDNSCSTSSGVTGELHVDLTSWRNVPLCLQTGWVRGAGRSVTTGFSGSISRLTGKIKIKNLFSNIEYVFAKDLLMHVSSLRQSMIDIVRVWREPEVSGEAPFLSACGQTGVRQTEQQ